MAALVPPAKRLVTVCSGVLASNSRWRRFMVPRPAAAASATGDDDGERQHTIYIGASPEYGKEKFLARLDREVERVKALYPKSTYVGVADGDRENWTYLEERTEKQVLDFYHATEYPTRAAEAKFRKVAEREGWVGPGVPRFEAQAWGGLADYE